MSHQATVTPRIRPIILAGPSGVGKGTIISKLLEEYPDKISHSVSHTTRPPREGEIDGIHYHFTTLEEIMESVGKGHFIEYANVHGYIYGTSFLSVESVLESGKLCILDVDVQGCKSILKSDLNPLFIFVAPPSMEELENRLRGRGTESEESIQVRLEAAKAELSFADNFEFWDHNIVNDRIEDTIAFVKSIIDRLFLPLPGNSSKSALVDP